MSSVDSTSGTIKIDVDAMREVVSIAIRRVSAFVRFGLDNVDERDGGDFNLTASLVYRFWPEVIPDLDRVAAREEYRAWLVGSCLRELDLFYGLFLDKIWFTIEVGKLHGTKVRSDHVFDQAFARKTNIAVKQKIVAKQLGITDYFDELNSLSLARNALAHHAGVVRSPVDCNNVSRNELNIKWLAFDMVASRNGEEVVVAQMPLDTSILPGSGEVDISLRFAPRVLDVPAGHHIMLSNSQIAELCMFYKIICDKTIDGCISFLRDKGIYVRSPEEMNAITDRA